MCFNFILIHLKLTLFALLLLTSCAEDMSPKSDESSSEVTPLNRPDNLSLVWSDEFDQGPDQIHLTRLDSDYQVCLTE